MFRTPRPARCLPLSSNQPTHNKKHAETPTTPTTDRERSFNVYIPPNYDGVRQQPVWAHLRGVYTAKWGGELQPQYPGQPILCRDACALWDGMAGGKREGLNPRRADNVIVVYPEAAFDDPNKRSVREKRGIVSACLRFGASFLSFLAEIK